MEEGRGIVFKGNAEGLDIVIPQGYTPEEIMSETEAKVSAASRFFKGAKINVAYRGRSFRMRMRQGLRPFLTREAGCHRKLLKAGRKRPAA